ncbi:MAG TPA: 2-oxo acid dehydrogenase subunit E2 [Polyangia bacterium]|jgi:hypothetical protein
MTMVLLIVCAVLFLGWVLLNRRTSRPDGTFIHKLHPFRRMMPYIMQGRNESIVFYDTFARAERLLEYLEQVRTRFPVDVTHCLVAGVARGLALVPKMNVFCVGRRLYRRHEREITFSMKRKQLDREAKLSAVKLVMPAGETFVELCGRINAQITRERSGEKTYSDNELSFLTKLPRPVLNLGVRLLRWLDYHGILPGAFIKGDAMYTSVFVANLGSVGMDAGFHHLYEWGTCPLFLMVGKVEERALVEDGKVVVRKVMPLRFSYDERIEDGFNAKFGIDAVRETLENPFELLGGVAADGSDVRALDAPPAPDETKAAAGAA